MQGVLERIGKEQGADPKHWFATSLDIQLHELRFQGWAGAWKDLSLIEREAAAQLREHLQVPIQRDRFL